jgi:hypothetical protein
MKKARMLLVAVMCCVTALAGGTFPAGKVIDRVPCMGDPTQSYALYIPVTAKKGPLPVIYFFDSHGAGVLPLSKYRALADTYGYILIGSNNSKNGNDYATAEAVWEQLFEDTRKRLPINGDRIYTGGFSGGAKVAGYIAIQHEVVKGVIVNGAGLPDEVSAGNFPFSFTAITGEGDMNMTELVAFNGDLDKTATRHRLLFYEGIHGWAPEGAMRIAFAGLELDAMQTGLVAKDAATIDGYISRSKSRLETDIREGQLINAYRECVVSISYLGAVDAGWFKQRLTALDRDPAYQKQLQAQQDVLATEGHTKEEYQRQFEQGDNRYWATTIGDLRRKAAVKSSGNAMYQRLLAYLSLEFYSISNHFLLGNDDAHARHFVQLYQMADPTNSEAWYFSAILDGRRGDKRAATDDLMKAVGYGFNEKDRLRRQPEFQGIDLSRIERAMR